jgi:cell wall-associated NlpC family hydrolase
MHNMLKYSWIIGAVALAATGCSTQRKATAPTQPVIAAKPSRQAPRFIENISIRPGDSSSNNQSMNRSAAGRLASGPAITTGGEVELSDPLQFKYSILLDSPVEELTDGKMIGFIEDWYGTRYKYGGNDKNGVDCSSFAQTFIYTMYGLMLPRTSAQQYQNSKRIRKDDLLEGDLVFFKTRGRKAGISHVGVYLRNNKFVHAATSGGVMINDINDSYYASHYAGAGRVR